MAKKVFFSKDFFGLFLSLLTLCTIVLTRQATPVVFLGWCFYLIYNSKESLSVLGQKYLHELRSPIFLSLIVLGIYSVISTLWSNDPSMTLGESLGILGMMLSFPLIGVVAQLKSWPSRIVQNGMIIFLISLVALAFQTLTDIKLRALFGMHVKTIKPNYELLSIMIIPLIVPSILEKKFISRAFMLLIYGLFFFIIDVKTSGIALLAFAFLWGISYSLKAPKFIAYCLMIVTTFYNFCLPFIFHFYHTAVQKDYFELPITIRSFIHRLYIWEYSSSKIMEKPWFGWGAGITRNFIESESVSGNNLQLLPSHPHNYVLQLWLELGVVGISLFTLTQFLILRSIAHIKDTLARSLYYAFYIFIMLILSSAHSLWHKWWIFWIALCTGLFIKLIVSHNKNSH